LDILLTGAHNIILPDSTISGLNLISKVYRNDDGSFTDLGSLGLTDVYVGSTAWGDYDNDGDLDIILTGTTWEYPIATVYQNLGNNNNWINIKCVGTVSNSSAIGAKVRVKASIFGKDVRQMREVSGGSNGRNSLNAQFGLGDATVIDSLIVEWTTGEGQILTAVRADTFLIVIEGVTGVHDRTLQETVPNRFYLYQNYPNPFNPITTIHYDLPQSGNVTLAIYNLTGQEVEKLVDGDKIAGKYQVQWNVENLPSGVYFYRLQVDNKFIDSRKMIVLK